MNTNRNTSTLIEPVALVETSDVARGLEEPGTSDRGTAEPLDPLSILIERAALERGIGRADLARLVALIEILVSPLPPLLTPASPHWVRLMQLLTGAGQTDAAQTLFELGGSESYSIARQILDRFLPEGKGVRVQGHIGLTFGIPLQATASADVRIFRDTSTSIKLVRHGVLNAGFDTGIGAEAFLRFGAQGIGVSAGAQAQAGPQLTVAEEFRFPVLEEGEGFIPLLVFLVGADSLTRIGELFEESMANLTPDPYRLSAKVELKQMVSGVAAAEAGLRTAGEQQKAAESRLTKGVVRRAEGQKGSGSRDYIFFDEKSESILHIRGVVQGIIRAHIKADFRAGVGGGIEIYKLKYSRDAARVWRLMSACVTVYVEAEGAVSLVASLLILGPLIPSLQPEFGGGIRLNWSAERPFEKDQIRFEGHELYVTSGDFDLFDGPAHETRLHLPGLEPGAYADIGSFLSAIQASTTKHRFPVGSTIGRNYILVLAKNKDFTVMLGSKYREWGFYVLGFLTLEFELSGSILSRIIGEVADRLLDLVNEDPKVKLLLAKVTEAMKGGGVIIDLPEAAQRAAISLLTSAIEHVREFFASGKLPDNLETLADVLVREIISGLKEASLHGEVGVGIAAGAALAKGAKVRVHASGSLRFTYDRNITELLRGELRDVLSVSDLRRLLRREMDESSVDLEITPKELTATIQRPKE